MWSVFLEEFRQLPRRLGGWKGAMLLLALTALGALPPSRFGISFLDPLVLFSYTAFAILFASSFSVRSFTEAGGVGAASDFEWVFGKSMAATAYGLLAFVLVLGAALYALNLGREQIAIPGLGTLLSLLVLALGLAWLAAAAGAAASLTAPTPAAALQLLRLGFFFIVLVVLMGTRFGPRDWREHGALLFREPAFSRHCLVVAAACGLVGWFFARRAMRILEDRRVNLSIL